MIQEYAAGYAFGVSQFGDGSFDGENLLGIIKLRPDWQAGRNSVPGGHVEPGETPIFTIVREFREETGLESSPLDWTKFAVLSGKTFRCTFFVTRNLPIQNAKTLTDEEIFIGGTEDFGPNIAINNVLWLAYMARSIHTDRARYFEIVEKY